MPKQQTSQIFIYKINSQRLAEAKWNLTLPLEEARRNEEIVPLASSQQLRWIDALNNMVNQEAKAKAVKRRIKDLRHEENSPENRREIRQLYQQLDKIQFKSDYVTVVIHNKRDYRRARKGFYINGVRYERLLGTTGGVKNNTIVFVSSRLVNELRKRIDYGGKAYGGTYSSSGADYAEMFEWQDGNPDGEDRRGMFVTLDGKYIRLANSKDTYILGIVSGNPTVLGDTAEDQWADMYERDIFGALKHDSTTENGLVLNPNYDNEKQYIARGQRKEWDAVGLMGKLVVVDDGTCEVNGFCVANDNGIGTKAETGYRVMERLDKNHIRVFVK